MIFFISTVKIVSLFLSIFILAGCTLSSSNQSSEAQPTIDYSNLYAQICETKNGPCTNVNCSLRIDTYQCAESISNIGNNCHGTMKFDEVMDKYQICGDNIFQYDGYQIYMYAQSLDALMHGTPAEVEKKLEEELQTVNSGGSSSWMSTLLASAGGAILGGFIADKLFGNSYAVPPKASANSAYCSPLTSDSLEKTKQQTSQRTLSAAQDIQKTKTNAQQKSTTTNKTSSTSQSKTFRKRRR